jgi:DNA-binding MarR family transcriptional regulator
MEMGLVNAEVAAHDRRVRRLSLSTEGQRLERRLTATQARQLSKVFDAAGEPATEAWRAVMRGLAAGRAGATA